jgi:RNA polymerase sigma-70 factor (ECF subfamily)
MSITTQEQETPEQETEDASGLAAALEEFARVRSRLFGIAYRILGNSSEAEDVVQEAWLRWQLCDRAVVREPAAFLATTATRIAINIAQSARARHESYIGEWLPTPVATAGDPTVGAENGEVLELAMLLVMERLTPSERAAFVLRQAFDYPYERIAEIIETTEVAARQLVSRARRRLAADRGRVPARHDHHRLFHAFMDAARTGDIDALERLLAADVVSYTDGAGIHRTARRPVTGRETVTRFLHGVSRWFWDDADVRTVEANGHECALISRAGVPIGLLSVTASEDGISKIMWIMSPDKIAIAAAGIEAARAEPVTAPLRVLS